MKHRLNANRQGETRTLHRVTRDLLRPLRLPTTAASGEYALLVCLLDRAVRDLASSEPAIARSARQWFRSQSFCSFGFEFVCDVLQLDSQTARLQLVRASRRF